MTQRPLPADSAAVEGTAARPRSSGELFQRQLEGIDAWHRWRGQPTHRAATITREHRLDNAREDEAIRQTQAAIVERTGLHLLGSGDLLRWPLPIRAVLVLRHEWFRDKVCQALVDNGVDVVARSADGAEALGIIIVEQPDLLLAEDTLPMLEGARLLAQVRRFAPATCSVAQVAYDDAIGPMLEAGARAACTRRMPPADVALTLRATLDA
jgi:CheY-like chemotaxis protein